MHWRASKNARAGFSLLELGVAMVLFGIALAGMVPLVTMQSKQLKKLEQRFRHGTTYYLVPSTNRWAAKLGAAAKITTEAPPTSTPLPVTLIDDGDAGYTETGSTWHTNSPVSAYNSDQRCSHAADGSETATWEFTSVTPDLYEVFVRWTPSGTLVSDAPYAIFDGATLKTTVRVDQNVAPSTNMYLGFYWKSLGMVSITSGVLRVRLKHETGKANHVRADAVRIAPVRNEPELLSVDKSLTGEEVTAHVAITAKIPP